MATAGSPMTENGARLWIRASPQGKRSGFVVLPDGAGGHVSFTVLPKPWASRGRAVRDLSHTSGRTSHVVLYEGEVAAVGAPRDVVGTLAVGLTDLASQYAGLLELGAAPAGSVAEPAPTGDPFASLIDLALLVQRSSLRREQQSFEGAFSPAVLRLLSFEHLVQEVEKVLFRARPRYNEHSEVLTQPRGRLDAHSLLVSQESGMPWVLSTFDELRMDTPLLRVIRAALRVVAATRLHPKIRMLRPGLPTKAAQFLHYLQGVQPIDCATAAGVAERLHLGPLDRPWQAAVDAAMPVLKDQDVSPQDDAHDSEVVAVLVSTEKVWEQCLEVALETVFDALYVNRDGALARDVMASPPWVRDTAPGPIKDQEAAPDFLLRRGDTVAVVDAKYKLASAPVVEAADGYQLFAYSHLSSLAGQATDVAAILRPTRTGAAPIQARYRRMPVADYPLWVASLPFPTRSDVRDALRWQAYIARLAAQLAEFSSAW